MPSVCAVILAAGSSARMCGINKQFIALKGIPVIVKSALAFEKTALISEIIIAAKESDIDEITRLCRRYGITKLKAVVSGGNERFDSVKNALPCVSDGCDYIAVHDGARPLVTSEKIGEIIEKAVESGAAIPAVMARDTAKITDGSGTIVSTPPRKNVFLAQTPQIFEKKLYLAAIQALDGDFSGITDDSMIVERFGHPVHIVEGDYSNIKITAREDIAVAEILMEGVALDAGKIRIGYGYDVHRLGENRRLIMGGLEIPFEKGLIGHSDADVVLHAISDAVLGALALGDIGKHFPDTDPAYKNADSAVLLGLVIDMAEKRGFSVGNIDCTIVCEAPKLAPYIARMRETIAKICRTTTEQISVKATTEEGLGLAGTGIGCHAVCIMNGH